MDHSSYDIKNIKNTTLPIIMSEPQAIEFISKELGINVGSLDELRGVYIENITLLEKDPESKGLSVKDIRKWIDSLSTRPYDDIHYHILRGFDTASDQAQNACLKIFEEPPLYARILIVVKEKVGLLDTILSRAIQLHEYEKSTIENKNLEDICIAFLRGEKKELVRFVFQEKYEQETARAILNYLVQGADDRQLSLIEEITLLLSNTNENPKHLLDRVILSWEI